ncbi:MAG: hypothetical protein Tsb0014_08410 [Pleurocapsa sp.]
MQRPLGEILIEAGLISIDRMEIALLEQEGQDAKIGSILASHGWIKQETADFFAERWQQLIKEEEKKPLVYYFQEARLVDSEQIKLLLKKQKQKSKKVRFHNLVVEEGYLSQTTVDFFLTYLFNFYAPRQVSFGKAYQILKEYAQGKRDFKNLDLCKAPLMEVTLLNVQLDSSNLRRANLTNCNLSNSSLVQVNLTRADLTKAVFSEANLENADLRNADLREANLKQANFRKTNLKNADLREANLEEANFAGANLLESQLDEQYDYPVFYDSETRFDVNFDPVKAGWVKH